jgi:hypothetical protein
MLFNNKAANSFLEYRSSVSRDYAVSFERRLFRIPKDKRLLPRPAAKVRVKVRLTLVCAARA